MIYDILAICIVVIFVPSMTLLGYKFYKGKTDRVLFLALTLSLFGVELIRFFTNATTYPLAEMPSNELTFAFISFATTMAVFATFANNKVGRFFTKIVILVPFVALIQGIVYPEILNLPNDNFAMMKAMYMLEVGLLFAISLAFSLIRKVQVKPLDLVYGAAIVIGYAGINALTIYFFEYHYTYDLRWWLTMVGIVVSVGLGYLMNLTCTIINKRILQKEESV